MTNEEDRALYSHCAICCDWSWPSAFCPSCQDKHETLIQQLLDEKGLQRWGKTPTHPEREGGSAFPGVLAISPRCELAAAEIEADYFSLTLLKKEEK